MKHSTGKPTKAEAARMDAIKELGRCVACRNHAWQYVEVHHLLSGGRRRGHMYTVGLCPWHHRGVLNEGESQKVIADSIGPSLAHGSKPFRAWFGTDDQLLDDMNEALGLYGPRK